MQVRSPDHDPEIIVRTLKRFVVDKLVPVETETKFAFRASALDGSAPVFVPLTALTLRARAPNGSDARASAPTVPTP